MPIRVDNEAETDIQTPRLDVDEVQERPETLIRDDGGPGGSLRAALSNLGKNIVQF